MLYDLQLAPGESVGGTRVSANNALMQTRAAQLLGGLSAPPAAA